MKLRTLIDDQKDNSHGKPEWFDGIIKPEKPGWYIVILMDNGGDCWPSIEYYLGKEWDFVHKNNCDDCLADIILSWSVVAI